VVTFSFLFFTFISKDHVIFWEFFSKIQLNISYSMLEKNSQKMTWSLEMNVKKRKENVGTNPPGLQGTGLSKIQLNISYSMLDHTTFKIRTPALE
jgi:hypothetical protein